MIEMTIQVAKAHVLLVHDHGAGHRGENAAVHAAGREVGFRAKAKGDVAIVAAE